jgi:type I restriction enzyme S subunit
MIEGLKPYAEYKESGERWLGQLPASWDLRRAKFLFREIDERSKTGKEELLSVSHKTGVTPRSQKNVTMFMAASNVGHKICRPQDLVINTLWAWMAALGVSKHTGIVSPAYGVYRPTNTEVFLPRFADQLLRTPFYADEYQRRSTGVNSSRLRLYPEAFFRIPIVLPPPDEQAAIVRFLDHANRKIDGFVHAKRKLIGLLNEQKQAIIHRAVTRGLAPDASLKPSGIPWLGDIPTHWEARKLGSLFLRQGSGTTPSGDAYYGGGIPWAMSGDLKDGLIFATKRTVTESALKDFSALKLHPQGSLLVAMYGATIGKSGVLTVAACSNQACCALSSPRSSVNPVFIQAIVNVARPHLMKQAYGGGQPNINAEVVRSLRVPLPPLAEQDSILGYLDGATNPIVVAIARTEREIALMQEYRTRLTADIVTGKLDVREAAAKLPDLPTDLAAEPSIDEALDETDILNEIDPEDS